MFFIDVAKRLSPWWPRDRQTSRRKRVSARVPCAEALEPRQLLAADLVITEFMASNNGSLLDQNGDSSDWVEVYNPTAETVSLDGWHLTDDAAQMDKWPFPDIRIGPDQYVVVFASGKDHPLEDIPLIRDLNATRDATFTVDLPVGSYDIRLTMGDAIKARDRMAIHLQGALVETLSTGPGEIVANTYGAEVTALSQGQLLVRLKDVGGKTPRAVINALVITPTEGGESWRFDFGTDESPVGDGFTSVTPASIYDVQTGFGWSADASVGAQDRGGNRIRPHANFKLSADGEYVGLVRPDGTVAFQYAPQYPQQNGDVSYGLPAVGADPGYLPTATPGEANREFAYVGFVEGLHFSAERGFYDSPFQVEITTETEGPQIRFTLDGTLPTEANGMDYNGPITISHTTTLRAAAFKPDFKPSDSVTQTYLFPADVLQQSASYGKDGSGLPAFVRWGHSGKNGDWEVDPDIVNHPNAGDRWTSDDLKEVPTFSIVLPWKDMFGPSGQGIYIQGDGVERVASIEMIDPAGDGFQQNGSVQIQGGSSTGRWKVDKLSMRFKFQMELRDGTPTGGPGKLEFPLYEDSPVGRFDNVILDAVLNHAWLHPNQHNMPQYIQDQYVADLHNAMGGYSPFASFAHVYINGLYWGMYYVHDRPDHAWAAEMFGGDKDEYHAIKHNGSNVINHGNGNSARDSYMAMVKMAGEVRNRPDDLELWEQFTQVLDIDNFITYLLANWFVGNHDWPGHNWYATAPDGGPWRFHSWDAEHVTDAVRTVGESPSGLHNYLSRIPEYLTRMADLVYKHYFNDGVLSEASTTAIWKKRMQEIDRAIVGESARWGDNRRAVAHTRSEWLKYNGNEGLLTRYFPTRSETVLAQIKTANPLLVPATDLPQFNQRGGAVTPSFDIELSAPQGVIYYTTNGSDPRLPGGDVSPQAIAYSSPFRLARSGDVKTRAWNDGEWSSLNKTTFDVRSELPLQIRELNFNPHDANPVPGLGEAPVDNDRYEFLELQNVGAQPIELQGVRLLETDVAGDGQGIRFTFAEQILASSQSVVVVADRGAFLSRYGTSAAILAAGSDGEGDAQGQYGGKLSNGGEQITLVDAAGAIIQQFSYAVDAPWPARAARGGSSLEILDMHGDPGDPHNWRASSEFGGSPGGVGLGPDGRVLVNEVLTHSASSQVEDRIELRNSSDDAIQITHWYLSDSDQDYFKFQITAPTELRRASTLTRGGYKVYGQSELGFGLKGSQGDAVWLIEADASGRPLRFVDHAEFGASETDVSLGRWPEGDAAAALISMTSQTFGSANSGPRASSVVVSEVHYDPADPFHFHADFDAGTAVGFRPELGAWNVAEGRYEVTPRSEAGGDTIATIPSLGTQSSGVRMSATVRFSSATNFNLNAVLIFDYLTATDFKFASIHAGANRWRIGRRDETGWSFLTELTETIPLDMDLDLRVEISGNTATLMSAGVDKVRYEFQEVLHGGMVGLGSKNGNVLFDDVTVEPLLDASQFQFVELLNSTGAAINLSAWKMAGTIDWTFGAGTMLRAGESLVLVSFDPTDGALVEDFRRHYGMDGVTALAGPFAGQLNDAHGVLHVLQPVTPGDPESGLILVDVAQFNNTPPWPLQPAGQGASLQRFEADEFGGLAASWRALAPSPGQAIFAQLGDMNLNGTLGPEDFEALALALSDPHGYSATYGVPGPLAGDADLDSDLDFDDIDDVLALVNIVPAGKLSPAILARSAS